MDENSSSEDEIVSFESKEEYSDEEEATDSLLKTIELIEENANVFDGELGEAIAEVEGVKSFPCEKCDKICKSKGGLTRHHRSKHPDGEEAMSSKGTKSTKKLHIPTVDMILVENWIKEITEGLRDEKIYPEKIVNAASSVKPSVEFLSFIRQILNKFARKRNQDVLLSVFYKEIYSKWKSFFPSCNDQKVVNLVLIHIPQKLVAYYKNATSVTTDEPELIFLHLYFLNSLGSSYKLPNADSEEIRINPEEQGPLSYIAGYVLHALYKRSKNSVHWNSTRSIELQTLLKSVREEVKDDKYIESLSRGGLWTPNEYVKCIAENAEYIFRQHLSNSKKAVTTAIPTEKIVDDILALPAVISVWENITTDLDYDISSECKKLTLENFIRLFVRVRSFSYAKDIVTRYKLKQKSTKKSLRTELKKNTK